jgi:hypothetical protein
VPVIRLVGFNGVLPQAHPITLPDNVGVAGSNMRPGFNDLRPWPQPSAVSLAANTVVSGATSLYRFGRDTASDTQYWMTWTQDVDVVRGLVGTDTTEQTYFSGTNEPKWVDNTFALASVPYPTQTRTLGVPPPTAAVTVGTAGGTSNTKEARAYVVTWVTDKLEESAPGPASAVSALVPNDATFSITFNETVPTPGAGQSWNITKRRLYRTANTGSGAVYLFVAEISNLSNGYVYADSALTTSLAGTLPSATWAMPMSTMIGLRYLWNGMFAGFSGKTLCISAQNTPYAWPITSRIILPETIVGLAVYMQTLVIVTNGRAYTLTGDNPAGLTLQPSDSAVYAGAAKRSVMDAPGGVVWAAPEGLVFFSTRGADIISDGVFSKEQWKALVPSSMVCTMWSNFLIISYNPGTGRTAMVFDWKDLTKVSGMGMPQYKLSAVYPLAVAFDNAWRDPLTGELYLLNSAGQSISKFSGGSNLTASFTSKLFRMTKRMNFEWLHVRADAYPVYITVTADGLTRVNSFQVNNGEPTKLPGGFKGREYQVTIATSNPCQEVVLATSLEELQKTP